MKKTAFSTRQWWLIGLAFIICHLSFSPIRAQSFTERLQQSNVGEGKVTVTHDKSIDELVNTTPTEQRSSQPQTEKTEKTQQSTTKSDITIPDIPDYTVTPDTIDSRKKVMKGYKVNGYRVQVFAGGNSRNDRIKAEKTGEEIKNLFPGEPVYVHFYSPRWLCRMGNYRTYEEAHEVLRNVKRLGYDSAIIVKGKITVQYP